MDTQDDDDASLSISQVTEKIFLSDENFNLEHLRARGIRKVLTIGVWRRVPSEVAHKYIEIYDSPSQNIEEKFAEAFAFIEGRERVLVHCQGGISRSPTVVIAWLMYGEGMGFRDAVELVRGRRPCVNPNYGFQKKLLEYARSIGKY